MPSLDPRPANLGRRLAAHLLRRTSFGFDRSDIERFSDMTADQAVDELLRFPALPSPPIDPVTGATWVYRGRVSANSSDSRLYRYVVAGWLDEAIHSPPNLLHKLMFFLHQNFTSDSSVRSTNLYNQLRLFRHYAKGSYKLLARKMCMDNGMMRYLDTRYSSKNNPNENFPRELLELFTIGKGPQIARGNYTHYTENDIKAAAKLFTGFRLDETYNTLDPDTGIPSGKVTLSQHDIGQKVFSQAFNGTVIAGRNTASGMLEEVDDLIDMVFGQLATAQNICRKLYRYFVHYDINTDIETAVILPLALQLKNDNYELEGVLKTLLKSEFFFDADDQNAFDELVGGIIKSPLDLFIGTLTYFKVPLPEMKVNPDLFYRLFYYYIFINFLCKESGMDPFNPFNVAGYPAYYQEPSFDNLWINSTSLSFRYLFADMLLSGNKILVGGRLRMQLDVMAFVNDVENIPDFIGLDPAGSPGPHAGPRIPRHLVSSLVDNLFPETLSANRFDYYLNDLLLDNLTELNWMLEWDTYIATGNNTYIKPQIEKLIRGVIQSPEYQVN